MSTALTLTRIGTAHRRRNRRIPMISAGRFNARLVNVSAVDTRPCRSESEVLTAQPSTSVTGPPPPSPARRLRLGPVVMIRRRTRQEWARVDLLHEGRDPLAKGCAYCTKAPPTQSALHPPPVAPRPRALHPDDTGNHQSDRGSPDPTGRSSSSPVRQAHPTGVLRCHDIRNSQKPRDNSVGLISTVSACRRTSVAGSGCASRSPRWRRPRPLAPRTRA